MTRTQIIWIIIGAVAVVGGGGAYLVYLLWPPDYAAWRREFGAIVQEAEAQQVRAQQLRDNASGRQRTLVQSIRTMNEQATHVTGLLNQISGSVRQLEAKVERLGTMATSGRTLTLGDGKQYTPQNLQEMHQQAMQQLGKYRQEQLNLQSASQTFRAAAQGMQQDSVQLGEAIRTAGQKMEGFQKQIDELNGLINGPDNDLPTAKRYPRMIKEQREILANMTEDLDDVISAMSGGGSAPTEVPPDMAGPEAQITVNEAAQFVTRLNQLIP